MRSSKIFLSLLILLLFAETGGAFPLTGVYYQQGNVAELEMYDGILHLGYWSGKTPATEKNLTPNTADYTWEGALRAPFTVAEKEHWRVRGFLGYHLQMASTKSTGGTQSTDSASGIQYGGAFIFDITPDIHFLADYLLTNLISSSATPATAGSGNTSLERYEAGLVFKLPQGGNLMAGYSVWSLPRELGSGMAFSGQTFQLQGFILGINYQILP